MSYPASVEQVISSSLRQKQSRTRRQLLPDGQDLPDINDVDIGVGLGGPILDFGREGGVRLETERGSWKWTWVNSKGNDDSLKAAGGVLLYPACRMPDVDLKDVPASNVVDSAVDYVRSLPDVSEYASISDLIADELAEKQTDISTDRYRGNTLDVIINTRGKTARSLIVFPSGPVGCHLNISPFLPTSDAKRHRPHVTSFRPSFHPVERFPTEILQICSSPFLSGSKIDREMTALLVRIGLTTHMLNVNPHGITCGNEDSLADTLRVGQLSHTETEGRRHMDVALDHTSWSKALIVDEGGGVWLWWEEKLEIRERLVKTMRLRKIRDKVSEERHNFFRIAFGSRPGTALVMSSRQLSVIDFESEKPTETLILELTGSGRIFTALEPSSLSRNATYTCIATNFEVMWVDELSVGPPTLTWRHDYGSGTIRDLRLQVMNGPTSELILLSSPNSTLVMVFDVPSNPPAHIRGSPRCLALPRANSDPVFTSLQCLDLGGKGATPGVDTHIVALDAAGAVRSFEMVDWSDTAGVTDMEGDQVMGRQHPEPIWTQAIRDIFDRKGIYEPAKPWSDKAKTNNKVLDLREIWLNVNDDSPDHDSTISFQAIEQHLRERDAPLDSFVTLGDLARDAVCEEGAGRAHALLPLDIPATSFNSEIASLDTIDLERYDLHQAAMLPVQCLTNDRTATDPMTDIFSTFAGSSKSPFVNSDSRYKRDTQRLILDLTLSRMVIHSEDINAAPPVRASKEPETADNLFERTGQLTLNDDSENRPDHLALKWLVPRVNFDDAGDIPETDKPTEGSLQTPAARALLSDWTIGSDPTEIIWKDWRRETSAVPSPVRRPVRPLPSPRGSAVKTFAQSQQESRYRPPVIAQPRPQWQPTLHGSNSIPNIMAHTQNARSSPPPVLNSSQSYQDLVGASTQVERGQFGGRPDNRIRKKAAKKRVGGF